MAHPSSKQNRRGSGRPLMSLGRYLSGRRSAWRWQIVIAGVFVAGLTLSCFAVLNNWLDSKIPFIPQYHLPGQALLGPGLYFGVLIFNLAVTFYLEEMLLGCLGTLISLGIFSLILFRIKRFEA